MEMRGIRYTIAVFALLAGCSISSPVPISEQNGKYAFPLWLNAPLLLHEWRVFSDWLSFFLFRFFSFGFIIDFFLTSLA